MEIVTQDTFPSKQACRSRRGAPARRLAGNAAGPCLQGENCRRPAATGSAPTLRPTPRARRRCAGPPSKTASLRLMISVDGSRPSQRVVFVPWSPPGSCTQALGKFEFQRRRRGDPGLAAGGRAAGLPADRALYAAASSARRGRVSAGRRPARVAAAPLGQRAVAAAGSRQSRQGRERAALGAGQTSGRPSRWSSRSRRARKSATTPRSKRRRGQGVCSPDDGRQGARPRGGGVDARLPGGGPVRQPAGHHARDWPGNLLRRVGLRLVLRRDDARRPGQHPQEPDAAGRRHGDRLAAVPAERSSTATATKRRSTATCSAWPSPSTTKTRCPTAIAPTG